MGRIGDERALIHAHDKKENGNSLGTPWKETHYLLWAWAGSASD